MKINLQMSILFWLWNSKADERGLAPIYCRLTILGKRCQFSTRLKISKKFWCQESESPKGNSADSAKIKRELTKLSAALQTSFDRLSALGDQPLPVKVRDMAIGKMEQLDAPRRHTIVEAFDRHILRFSQLVAKDKRAPGTLARRKISKVKVLSFIQAEYGKTDYFLDQIKFSFASNFGHYLETEQGLGHNISMKYVSILKLVLKEATLAEWIDRNPLATFQCSYEDPNRQPITMAELELMTEKQISTQRLAEVRDVYVFCCYTGFGYQEVFNLSRQHLVKGIDNRLWLSIDRRKTGHPESVPVLPMAKAIIERYQDHPRCIVSGKLLPVNTNQSYNAYLKEIASICGINKNLTTHTARHTFATTVALENGVPIETVSKILGHTSIKTTQIYARITQRKIGIDMEKLEATLNEQANKQRDLGLAK